MKDLRYYADLILSPDPIIVEKAPVMEAIEEMASAIHQCPVRNRGREYSHIFNTVKKGKFVEYGLVKKTGFQLNPLEFDHTNPRSYAYDVIDGDVKIECKSLKQKYFSFNTVDTQTMEKNLRIIDYFVCAKEVDKGDAVEVYFGLIGDAKTFRKYKERSNYSSFEWYYNHPAAVAEGNAFYVDLSHVRVERK